MTPFGRPRSSTFFPYAVLAAATLLAVLPLLLHGPSCGHDLTFHLLNWMDAARQWRMGTLRPWWCFAGAWNTGEPRYLLYPPLSWMLGALLSLVAGPAHAPLAFTAMALFACGVTMRRFLLHFVGPAAALLGGCLYLAQPYMLFTAFERTAYAELLAAAWLPWLLGEALRERVRPAGLAVPVGLLWLTNMPAAVLATYTLGVVLVVRTVRGLWWKRREAGTGPDSLRTRSGSRRTDVLPTVLGCVWGLLWGLAASAFYLLPALVQHTAVTVDQALTGGMQPREGMLFTRTGEALHDAVVRQASWIAVVLLATAAVALSAWLLRRRHTHRLTGMRNAAVQHAHAQTQPVVMLTFAVLSVLVLFLWTPASTPVWTYAPQLRFLQFPFRTLALQGGVTVALMTFAAPLRLRLRSAVPVALAAVAALTFTAHHTFAQFCDDEDAPRSVAAQYARGDGFEPYDEYTPADADNDLLHAGTPPAWTAATAKGTATAEGATRVLTVDTGRADTRILQARPGEEDRFLIVRQRRFRNWHVLVDGSAVETEALRDDDLLAIPVSPGVHQVELAYRWSADEIAGAIVSALAVLGLALFAKPVVREA